MFDKYPRGHTPVDFFDYDLEKFPLMSQFEFLDVTLKQGDCMYIPAFYYVQSKTVG